MDDDRSGPASVATTGNSNSGNVAPQAVHDTRAPIWWPSGGNSSSVSAIPGTLVLSGSGRPG